MINNRAGHVEVSGLTGEQQVRNTFGQVNLKNIAGAVDITNRNDSVTVEDITGSAKISNEFGNVDARGVSGNLEVRNRNANVEINEVKGDASVNSSFGDISLMDITGNLDVDGRNASVDVARVGKNARVKTRFHYVKIAEVKGSVDVDNENGGIEVRFNQPPVSNIQLSTKFSDITVVLPAESAFSIDARTRYSNISSDFDELTASNRDQADRNVLTGRVKTGGPEIRINNNAGNIHIEK
jgi:hypothetical protein